MRSRTYEYSSYTDDFAATQSIKSKTIGDDYKYDTDSRVFATVSFLLYYLFGKPISKLIMKLMYHQKFVNKKCISRYKGGCYIYGNHTNYMPDAFLPNNLRLKRNYIVTNSDSVSIPGIKHIVQGMGALPLGDTLKSQKNFVKFMDKSVKNGNSVTIYPEAHIWPYYTKVRPFPSSSFKYPVNADVPAFAMTICYRKRLIGKKPRIVCCLDGPFYPDKELPKKDREEKLRNDVFCAMQNRTAQYSNYSFHQYVNTNC